MSGKDIINSLEVIEARIFDKLRTDDISGSVFVSKYHYQRMFHDIVGDSVMGYVRKRKLSLAGKELVETDSTILEIALKFGYSSHEGFTRAFKAYMGITPIEYRRYGLSSISQKQIEKERVVMNKEYEKSTDAIVRDLNDFIVQAKQTAEFAVKNSPACHEAFWGIIAERTNSFADKLHDSLSQITAMCERPDEITKRFEMIKIIEDVAFHSNLLVFNVGLCVSRNRPEYIKEEQPFCEKFEALAKASTIKSGQIAVIFNSLAGLIFVDMEKLALEKTARLIESGKNAVSQFDGYSYIKNEVSAIVSELSEVGYAKLSPEYLEGLLFRMDIITFTASIDITRSQTAKPVLEALQAFSDCLAETKNALEDIVKPEENSILQRSGSKRFNDIAYHGNILYFYLNGEISHEKLGNLLTDEQKAAFGVITDKLNRFIHLAIASENASDVGDVLLQMGAALDEIIILMTEESQKLADKGGPTAFLANEVRKLKASIVK